MRASTFSLLIAPSLVAALVPRQAGVSSVASAAESGAASVATAAGSGASSVASAGESGASSAGSAASSAVSSSGSGSATETGSGANATSTTGTGGGNSTTGGGGNSTTGGGGNSTTGGGGNSTTGGGGNSTTGGTQYGLPNNVTLTFPSNLTIPQECSTTCSNFTTVAAACRQNATGEECLTVCEPASWRILDQCRECLDDADVEGADDLDHQQDVLEALCLRKGINPEAWTGSQTPNITVHFPSNVTVPQSCQSSCGNFTELAKACTQDSNSTECLSVCEPESFTKFHSCVKCLDKSEDKSGASASGGAANSTQSGNSTASGGNSTGNSTQSGSTQSGNSTTSGGNSTTSSSKPKQFDFTDQEDKLELICRLNGKDPKASSNSTSGNSTVELPTNVSIPTECEVMCPGFSTVASACSKNATDTECLKVCDPIEWRLLDLCIGCLDDNDVGDYDDQQDKLEQACRAQGLDPKLGNSTASAGGGGNQTTSGGNQTTSGGNQTTSGGNQTTSGGNQTASGGNQTSGNTTANGPGGAANYAAHSTSISAAALFVGAAMAALI